MYFLKVFTHVIRFILEYFPRKLRRLKIEQIKYIFLFTLNTFISS